MDSFREVIELWDSHTTMAKAIGANVETVKKWHQRNSIPSSWWPAVTEAARDRDTGVTFSQLAALAEARRKAS